MSKKIRKIVSFFLSISLIFSNYNIQELSAEMRSIERKEQKEEIKLEGFDIDVKFSNILTNSTPKISGDRYKTFLKKLAKGGYRIAVYADKLIINDYNDEFQLLDSKKLELELPIWGGIYLGDDYNYVICGQNRQNGKENGGETYRIIKYNDDFERVSSLSLYSDETYTVIPFDYGNVSMDIYENQLTIYTSRKRLDAHQSNIALRINTDSMTVQNTYGMLPSPDVHTSHSMRQIVKYDKDVPVYVDLSDAAPVRSVYIQVQEKGISKPLMNIAGSDGDNLTNTEVSGLEITDTNYLVTGSYQRNGMNNIFLSSMNKNSGEVINTWLTNETVFNVNGVSNSRIVALEDEKYMIMWQQWKYNSAIEYVITDAKGENISEVKLISGVSLSDCNLIYNNRSVLWVNIKNGVVVINKISNLNYEGKFDDSFEMIQVENPWDGTIDISWYKEEEKEFEIGTAQELAGLAQLVNNENTFEQKTIHLTKDIFLNGEYYEYEWIPIAYCNNASNKERCFQGTFYGHNHKIVNMYILENGKGGGLFGRIGNEGMVNGVNIIQGILYRGGCIANCNEGKIAYCNSYSLVGGGDKENYGIGGICNYNEGLIYGCKNYGCIWGRIVGGIVAHNRGTISECSNHGRIEGSVMASGICDTNWNVIYNCYNVGTLSNTFNGLNAGRYMAGIVHNNNDGYVYSCYFAGVFTYIECTFTYFCVICCQGEEGVVNSYAVMDGNYSYGAQLVTVNELKSNDIIDKLNQTTYIFGSPAWCKDESYINAGLPVTQADIKYEKGIFKIVLGDVNSDDEVNIQDSALLRRYLAGWNVTLDKLVADVNGDGQQSLLDSALLRRYLAGWNVELK